MTPDNKTPINKTPDNKTTADITAIELIHSNSLRILSELGMAFHSPQALELLRNGGVKVVGDRAYFTEKQVMDAVQAATKTFTVYARNPKYNINIDSDRLYITPGYGSASIAELDGTVRDATFDDFLKLAAIVQQSEAFQINGGILAQPRDIPSGISAEAMVYTTLKMSDKALFSVFGDETQTKHIMEMLRLVFGNIENKPCSLTLISTHSPLAIDSDSLDTLRVCATNGQPLVIAPGPMAGGTGPVSLAGNISICNAEILGANVYTQMVRPGTPVIYGFAATVSDLRDMKVSNACPGFVKEARYGAMLAKRYGFACRSGGGMSDAGGLTAQAGVESAMGLFEAFSEGANLVMHATGSLHSFGTVSFEKFILDIETVSRMRYYFDALPVDEDALAFDAIKEVVEDGTGFMLSSHTVERCRSDPWQSEVSLHGASRGTPNAELYASIHKRMNGLLARYTRPEMSVETEQALDRYMLGLGMSAGDIARVAEAAWCD